MSFDPYTQWLHLPPGPRPPRVWELLGLSEGEADQERIRQAVLRRYAQVRPYQTGPHGREADRLLEEISQALTLLTAMEVTMVEEATLADLEPASPEEPTLSPDATTSDATPPPLPPVVPARPAAPSPQDDEPAELPPVEASPLSPETLQQFFTDKEAPAPATPTPPPKVEQPADLPPVEPEPLSDGTLQRFFARMETTSRAKSKRSKPKAAKTEPPKPKSSQPKAVKPKPAKSKPSRPKAAKPEPVKRKPAKRKPAEPARATPRPVSQEPEQPGIGEKWRTPSRRRTLVIAGVAAAALLLVAIVAAKIVTANRSRPADPSVAQENRYERPDPTREEDDGTGTETSTLPLPGTVEPVPPTPELPEQPNPPEPPFRPPEEMPPPKKTWEQLAAEYAERQAGVLLSEKPLVKGEFAIPPAALPPRADTPTPYLGPGTLLFGSETYEFGNGFPEDGHVTHHEIPKLSEELELPGIEVKLVSRSDGPYLVVSAGNMPAFADLEKECDEELGPLKQEFNEISSNLRKCERRSAPLDERAEALAALATRFNVELPTLQPKPDPRERQFFGERGEYTRGQYNQALGEWNKKFDEWNRQVGQKAEEIAKLAKERKAALLKDIEAIKDKYSDEKTERLKQFTAVRTRLEDESRKITAVVYQGAGLPASPTLDSPGLPDTRPAGPAETVRDIAGSLVVTVSRVATEEELQGHAALVEPRVSGIEDALPPRWFTDKVSWRCDVRSLVEGAWQESIQVLDSEGPRAAPVRRGATSVRLRFRFFRSTPLGEPELIGDTGWSRIEGLEAGKRHTVTCRISDQEFEQLRKNVPQY